MKPKIRNLIIDSILLALLIVASKISIYTAFVPFTLQLLVVLVIVLLFDLKNSLIIILTYILMGLCGIPVFSNNYLGISALLSPSFGFILGFIFMGLIISFIKKKVKMKNEFLFYLIASLIGLITDYMLGFLYVIFLSKVIMVIDINLTLSKILINFILIFIPFDLIKCFISAVIVNRLKKVIIRM